MSRIAAPVALVAGRSRGAGRGVAAGGRAGYTVYLTGRTLKAGDTPFTEEHLEFARRITHTVATAPDLAEKGRRAFYRSKRGGKYGIADVDGSQPVVFREMLGGPLGWNRGIIAR